MKNVLKLYWRHTLNKVRNYCNTKTTTTFPYEVKNNITCFSIFKQNIWYGLRNSVEVYIFRSMHTKNLTKKKKNNIRRTCKRKCNWWYTKWIILLYVYISVRAYCLYQDVGIFKKNHYKDLCFLIQIQIGEDEICCLSWSF